MNKVLGRTNWAAPRVWFAPVCDRLEEATAIVTALPTGSVVVVNGPVVAQACLGRDVVRLFDLGFGYESGVNASHTADLVSADLLRAMSLAGSASGLLLTLPVRQAMWGGQVDGALRALEGARQDGIVRHLGIRIAGPWAMAEPVWHRHDAFEFVVSPADMAGLSIDFAATRRVGVVIAGGQSEGAVQLVEARTVRDLEPYLALVAHGA